MKYTIDRPFAEPDKAARRLLEHAATSNTAATVATKASRVLNFVQAPNARPMPS